MRLFRSAEEAQGWCAETGNPFGAIVELPTLQRLAVAWYGDRLDPAWEPRTPERAQAALDAVGLDGAFWRLSP